MIWECLYLLNVLIDLRLDIKYRIYYKMKRRILDAQKQKYQVQEIKQETEIRKEVKEEEEIKEKKEVAAIAI